MLRLAQVLTVIALVAGVPLFLRMPVWADITLYDVAARNLLAGGVHYRDVFDTNLPGYVWLLTAFRAVVGKSFVAVRVVDLFLFTLVVLAADRLARRSGASLTARWWSFAAIAFWYPCSSELIHGQRDVWMGVPALAAVCLRVRRFQADHRVFRSGCLEGLLWGSAVWIKPHLVPVALIVWLATVWPLDRSRRGVIHDLCGNLAGGTFIGALGLTLLLASGSGPDFQDVFTNWNTGYFRMMLEETPLRAKQALFWFPPWSIGLLPTVILCGVRIVGAIRFGLGEPARFTHFTLCVLYLAWVAQGLCLQRRFQYVHVVETVLMFAVWASVRYWLPIMGFVWLAVTSTLWLVADGNPALRQRLENFNFPEVETQALVPRHAFSEPERMKLWPTCWRVDLDKYQRARLRDSLRFVLPHEASTDWTELEEVAAFLRSQGVQDGEVVAWHNSPHVVYLLLDIKPGVRFLHVNTAQSIPGMAAVRVQEELERAAPRLRFAVSDLERAAHLREGADRARCLAPAKSETDLLPPRLPKEHRRAFPFCQPTVFRAGRYVVHRIELPIGNGLIPP